MALENLKQKYIPQNNDFYRDHYHKFFWVVMGLIAVLILTISFAIYLIIHRPLPPFTGVQPDGKQMVLTPFEEPNLLPDTILRWASKAATAAYTFDFVNYEKQVNAVKPYFTDAGWNDYMGSIRGLLNNIVQNQLFVNGVVSGPPVISNQGDIPGRGYVWRVQIPFLVTYQSANTVTTVNYFVIISIVKVPTHTNPQGIGIDQFVMA